MTNRAVNNGTVANDGTGDPAFTAFAEVNARVKGFLHVEEYGALGDGVTDDAAAINLAIAAGIANNAGVLLTPGKTYSIASPLICGNFAAGVWTYSNLYFGTLMWPAYVANISANIVPTFNDRPALCIQMARGHIYHGFRLVGLNDTSALYNTSGMMTNANWVTASCRDSRYSPYAGIAIDPFSPSVPADGGYSALSAYYVATASNSSLIRFIGVMVSQFVVGTIITSNGSISGADNITFDVCEYKYNKVNVAICNAQSRQIHWRQGSIGAALYCFDGVSYGQQQGVVPFILGANMSGKFLFNTYVQGGQAITIDNIHVEVCGGIGYLGASASGQQPVIFRNCDFNFGITGQNNLQPDYHLHTNSVTKFDGCNFRSLSGYPLRLRHQWGLTFDNCELPTQNSELMIAPCEMHLVDYIHSYQGNAAPKGLLSKHYLASTFASIEKWIIPLGAEMKFLASGAITDKYINGSLLAENVISLGSLTLTVTTGVGVFTASDVAIVRLGDLIYTTTSTALENSAGTTTADAHYCLGTVTAINSSDVTVSGLPQSCATGTYALQTVCMPRFHSPSTGDTNTSTSLTNVTPITAWANGNRIKGTGIPVGAYVVSGGGTATLVISKAATATANVRLYDANIHLIAGTAV